MGLDYEIIQTTIWVWKLQIDLIKNSEWHPCVHACTKSLVSYSTNCQCVRCAMQIINVNVFINLLYNNLKKKTVYRIFSQLINYTFTIIYLCWLLVNVKLLSISDLLPTACNLLFIIFKDHRPSRDLIITQQSFVINAPISVPISAKRSVGFKYPEV